ncbi:MAG: hypothetical protein KAZ71_07460 [Bacteroidia bacterium]|nr:hypothetical protein [Bacteroidia bacterium]
MKTKLILIILFLRQFIAVSCCAGDDRTLIELLFQGKPGTIFTCKIISMTVPKPIISSPDSNGIIREEYSSMGGIDGTAIAEIIRVYFGKVDTNIVTLKTGSFLTVGKSYIIYSGIDDKVLYCGGGCDNRTHLLTGSKDEINELKIIEQFSNIYKKKKSGKFSFYSTTNKLLAEGNFKKGVPIKIWKHYHTNGNLKSELDLQTNHNKYFNGNSLIIRENITYKDSSRSITYFGNADRRISSRWVTMRNEKGNLSMKSEYYTNGNLKILEGQQSIFDTKGHESNEGKAGKYIEGYENGVIKVIGAYLKSKRIGLWKWYNEDGSFYAEYDYKDGANG